MDICVVCGAYTPEGRQICHACAWEYGLENTVGIETMSAAEFENAPALAGSCAESGKEK